MSTTPYTKHTTHTDALDTLGSIIGPNEARDAIHLAVEPAVCGENRLKPGEHVYRREDGCYYGTTGATGQYLLGIVDPFLTADVKKGQRFWLVVYPRQITSLRHVWEHPAFAASGETAQAPDNKRAAAEAWLRDFCGRADCPGFEAVVAKALRNDGWNPEEYLHFDGQDAHGEIPPEFWEHMEAYTGRTFGPSERPTGFSCSC